MNSGSPIKILYAHKNWLSVAVILWLFTGCCPDIEHDPDSVYETLTRNEFATFIDSSGNHEQILLTGEGRERVYDDWNECSHAEGYAQYPWAEFELLHGGGTMRYEQKERRLRFNDFSFSYFSMETQNITIQGHQYLNCGQRTYSDSVGHIASVIVDQQYGLVMFSYRDQYRWERVLEE